MVIGLVEEGYDVYLLDFGEPDGEDKDLGLEDYIFDYIDPAIDKVLQHSQSRTLSLMGFCLGGTLAAIYAAFKPYRVKNLILMVTPINFDAIDNYSQWQKALKNDEINFEELINMVGIIPANFVKAGMRLYTAPVYFSPYLALLNKAYDPEYREFWYRFNQWTNDHIPLTGAFLIDILNVFIKKNSLINGNLVLRTFPIQLSNIHSNIYMLNAKYDELVPTQLSYPLLELVSSPDKVFIEVEGGHASIIKKNIPPSLIDWLEKRSL
ncbi:alpha/beta fold hydrolase [Falsibacillus albus]|uniref:Alpha/beta fold hydrolase n=2 Tax=Falsibacillus albus TaxID=2478915 RepID=A0A3L7K0K1_9BACI|nr:alpha/beta fold hydrolase [Falsibacillus albus]